MVKNIIMLYLNTQMLSSSYYSIYKVLQIKGFLYLKYNNNGASIGLININFLQAHHLKTEISSTSFHHKETLPNAARIAMISSDMCV